MRTEEKREYVIEKEIDRKKEFSSKGANLLGRELASQRDIVTERGRICFR